MLLQVTIKTFRSYLRTIAYSIRRIGGSSCFATLLATKVALGISIRESTSKPPQAYTSAKFVARSLEKLGNCNSITTWCIS